MLNSFQIRHCVHRATVSLRLPDGLGEAFEQDVLGVVRVKAAAQPFVGGTYARRLIDTDLFLNGQM